MTKEEAIIANKKWLDSLTPTQMVSYLIGLHANPNAKFSEHTHKEISIILRRLKMHFEGCKHCWMQEGGRCYAEPCERMTDGSGRSTKMADGLCPKFQSKREVLESVIPGEMLILASEGFRDPTDSK